MQPENADRLTLLQTMRMSVFTLNVIESFLNKVEQHDERMNLIQAPNH